MKAERLLDAVWPRRCELCAGAVDRPGRFFCSQCLMSIPFVSQEGGCKVCGRGVEGYEGEYVCEKCRERAPFFDVAVGAVDFAGEKYRVLAAGEAGFDEFNNPIYKIELVFPELPNVRYITITEEDSGIKLRLSEAPNERVVSGFIENLDLSGFAGFAMGALEKRLGENFIMARLTAAFNPEISGIDKRITDVDEIINEKNRQNSLKKESSGKLLKTIVARIAPEKKPDTPDKNTTGGFLRRALSSIKSKMRGTKKSSSSYDISVTHDDIQKNDTADSGENAE